MTFDSFFGLIDTLQTIFPDSVSMAKTFASFVILNTRPFPGLSEILDTDFCELFGKPKLSGNFTFRDITGEDASESVLVRKITDDSLTSSIATCKVD